MAADAIRSDRLQGVQSPRAIELACFALCVANAAYLAASFAQGTWLIGTDGLPVATDFVNFWAAGRQVLEGHAADAYVGPLHKVVEAAAVGHPFAGDYPLIYPPTFLFVSVALAAFPYLVAYVGWVLLTFPAYLLGIRAIVGWPAGFWLACAYPGIVSNFVVGQNGFVTAGLLAATFTQLERRPLLAGACLGLLSFKPHLGVLFPIVLIAGGHWRVIAGAAATILTLAVASVLAFGLGTWESFVHAATLVSHAALDDGVADLAKLQSVFGLTRMLGGGEHLAWTLQGLVAGIAALAVSAMWRRRVPFELKAAALATGALLATPYLFVYDLAALAVPMAYLLGIRLRAGALSGEMAGLGAASLLVLVFPFVKAPVGLAAVLVVAALIARRALIRPDPVDVPFALRPASITSLG